VPVCGSRRGVDEAGARGAAPVEEPERKTKVRLHNQVAVPRRGVGNGPQMEDGFELAPLEPAHELAWRHDIEDAPLAQVAPLAGIAQNIINNDIASPALIKVSDQIRADESGASGDQQHHALLRQSRALCTLAPRPPLTHVRQERMSCLAAA